MSDFELDSMGSCFVCLTPISAYPASNETSSSCSYSLQRLSCYVNLDTRKMFTAEQLVPPSLLTMVERSRLKTQLCQDCAHLVQQFSRLHQQMEQIQMEMNSALGRIREKFLEVDKADFTGNENGRFELVEKMNILNALREEAVTKCELIHSTTIQVLKSYSIFNHALSKLENLATKTALREQLQSNGLSCTSLTYQQYILPNSDYEELKDSYIDMGIVKVEPELHDLANSASDSETVSNGPDHSQINRKNTHPRHTCELCGKTFDNLTYLKLHQKRVHSGRNFRCQKCNKTFTRNEHLTYHQRPGYDCVARQAAELSKEGKFYCRLCNNRFVEAGSLARHFRSIHLKLKEHGCNLCKMKFARKDALRSHMRRIHKMNQ